MEVLLEACTATIEQALHVRLTPTYSYCRIYSGQTALAAHVDRPACEITATICLGYEGPSPWPLCLRGPGGGYACEIAPGDALVYEGTRVTHWREPWSGSWQAQVFLHYVRSGGRYSDEAYDRRRRLGLPPTGPGPHE